MKIKFLALLLFIGMATADAGLVGYWKCDENNGTAVLDSSGNGLTGTIYNATNWTTGKNYQTPYALKYDGTGQYVSLPNVALLNVSNVSFTISAWVNPTSETAANTILGKVNTGIWYPGTVFYIASVAPAGRLTLSIYNSSTTGFDILTTNIIPTNKWTHVAVTWNTTHACFYINGVLDAGGCQAGTIPLNPNNIYAWYIGNVGQKNIGFNGTIDDVAIYNESKSASWVMSDYLKYCPLGLTNIITYNESSTSQSVTFGITASNTTSSFSYSPFTDYYCNSSFPTGSATISISNTSFYSPRYYYQTLTYGGNYNLSAYLLPLNDLYATSTTIYVKDSSGASIVGATVSMYKQISSVWTLMAQDTTDSIGGTYFNLDSATMYELFANDTCCIATSITLQPTQAVYTITMQTSSTSNQSIFNFTTQGVSWNVTPSSYLLSGTQNFNFSIYNTNNDFEFWGIRVYYNGTQQYFSNQTTSLGGYVNYTMNASDTTDNSINVSIFFKRIGGTYFDPTYQYWGHSISTSNLSLVDAMVRIGDSALSPLTKGIIAAVFITCIAGYVGTAVSFSGGVVLELLMLWGFASFGFIQITPLLMLTLIGGALIYNRHFALTPVG